MTDLNGLQKKDKEKIGGKANQQIPTGQGQKPTQGSKQGNQTRTGGYAEKNPDRDDSGQAR